MHGEVVGLKNGELPQDKYRSTFKLSHIKTKNHISFYIVFQFS